MLASEKAKRSDYDGEAFMIGKQLWIKWIRAQDVPELTADGVTAYLFGQDDTCLICDVFFSVAFCILRTYDCLDADVCAIYQR